MYGNVLLPQPRLVNRKTAANNLERFQKSVKVWLWQLDDITKGGNNSLIDEGKPAKRSNHVGADVVQNDDPEVCKHLLDLQALLYALKQSLEEC